MSEKEWDRFFDLLGKIINLDGMSAGEKAKEVRRQAEDRSSCGDLTEFCDWADIMSNDGEG